MLMGNTCARISSGGSRCSWGNSFASVSDTLPVESGFVAGAKYFEGPCFADCVRANEDPVLPGGQAPEYARLHRLTGPEPQTGLHAGQRIRRESPALLESDSDLILPVELVGPRRDQPEPV